MMLTHAEFSEKAHQAAHEAAEETNELPQFHTFNCFHRTNGQAEHWTKYDLSDIWMKDGVDVLNPDLDDEGLAYLVGRKIVGVDMDEEYLRFHTDTGETLTYTVEGDCCSRSYFYDMVGKHKLIENGPIVSFRKLDLSDPDDKDASQEDQENGNYYVQAYGFELVTAHPKWGEQTTVVSFRNSSNGCYGGWMIYVGTEKTA